MISISHWVYWNSDWFKNENLFCFLDGNSWCPKLCPLCWYFGFCIIYLLHFNLWQTRTFTLSFFIGDSFLYLELLWDIFFVLFLFWFFLTRFLELCHNTIFPLFDLLLQISTCFANILSVVNTHWTTVPFPSWETAVLVTSQSRSGRRWRPKKNLLAPEAGVTDPASLTPSQAMVNPISTFLASQVSLHLHISLFDPLFFTR